MRNTPQHVLDDPDEIRRLIRENPSATIVSNTSTGLVASHYPVLLDEGIQVPHGYISPGWSASGDVVPTWNHLTAHLRGIPEILSSPEILRGEESLPVLGDLVHCIVEQLEHGDHYAQPALAREMRLVRGA